MPDDLPMSEREAEEHGPGGPPGDPPRPADAQSTDDSELPEGLDSEEQALLRRAQEGEREAFVDLYARLAPALHTWAELRIRPGQRAWVEPQDLVQEVWFRAWRSLPDYETARVPFRQWIFRVAKNVLLEALRQLREPDRIRGGGGPSTRLFAIHNLPDSVTAASQKAVRDESLATFAQLVRGLEEEEQKLVLHCGLEALAYGEVAQRMGLSVDAVAKRWQRLRQSLRERGLPSRLLTESSA